METNEINKTDNFSGIVYPDGMPQLILSLPFSILLYAVGGIPIVLNMPSLLIVITTFLQKKKLKYVHILSLSITDILVGVSWLLMTGTLSGTYMSFVDCALRSYMLVTAFVASMLQVLGICLERVLVICLDCVIIKQEKNKVSIFIVTTSWILSGILTAAMFVIGVVPYAEDRICSFYVLLDGKPGQVFGIHGIVMTLIEIAVVITMMVLVVYLRYRQRKVKRLGIRAVTKSDIKLCATIGIIAVLFFIFNAPITVVNILEGFYPRMQPSRTMRNATFMVGCINSTINPFFYMFRIQHFRELLAESISYLIPCSKATAIPSPSSSSHQQNMTE